MEGSGDRDVRGRLRTSATTLAAPATWRMSEENSEMKDKCLVCRGDFSEELLRAPQRGLVFCPNGKRAPLEDVPEVLHGEEDTQQLPVKFS